MRSVINYYVALIAIDACLLRFFCHSIFVGHYKSSKKKEKKRTSTLEILRIIKELLYSQ